MNYENIESLKLQTCFGSSTIPIRTFCFLIELDRKTFFQASSVEIIIREFPTSMQTNTQVEIKITTNPSDVIIHVSQ